MSGQETEQEVATPLTADELRARINVSLGDIGDRDREIAAANLVADSLISSVTTLVGGLAKPGQDVRDRLMDSIVDDFNQLMAMGALKGKTLVVANGKVAIRDAPEAMVVPDRKAAIAWLRKEGLLRKTTKIKVVRELVKDKVKQLPAEVLARLYPLLHFETKTRITATPNTSQIEVTRDVNPHVREVG